MHIQSKEWFKNMHKSTVFFVFFWLLPLGDATADHLPPSHWVPSMQYLHYKKTQQQKKHVTSFHRNSFAQTLWETSEETEVSLHE